MSQSSKVRKNLEAQAAPPQLTVNPVDRSEKGSWKEIKTIMELSASMQGDNFDPGAFYRFMTLIESRCEPPEGYELEDVLEQVPFDDMIELSKAIVGGEVDGLGEASGAS
jgi:hypothetical protein